MLCTLALWNSVPFDFALRQAQDIAQGKLWRERSFNPREARSPLADFKVFANYPFGRGGSTTDGEN